MHSAEDGTLWYAIHVRTRFERAVARNLRGKGYEEFRPLLRRTSHWSDRKKEIELPLFPGYVFCRFKALHRLPILMIPGVSAIVGIGKTLMPSSQSLRLSDSSNPFGRKINHVKGSLFESSEKMAMFITRCVSGFFTRAILPVPETVGNEVEMAH